MFDEFKAAMVKATNSCKVREGSKPEVYFGPIQNDMQYSRVKTFYDDINAGLNLAASGGSPDGDASFLTPTLIDRPPRDFRIVTTEPFGKCH